MRTFSPAVFKRLRFRLYAILSSGEFADGTYQFNSRSDANQRELWLEECWSDWSYGPQPEHLSAEVRVR